MADTRAIINIIDNLISTSITDALSANQGRVLKELIDGVSEQLDNTGMQIENHLTGAYNLNDFTTFGVHWFKGDTELTNQPSGVVNGWLIVLHSELTVKQIWLRSGTPNSTDHHVYQRTYADSNGWSTWKTLHHDDTGWKNLTLASGVSAYGTTATPQYRKINGVVYLRGAVKGITQADTTIATLPTGYRPSRPHPYPQLTSTQGNSTNYSRIVIDTNGEITMEGISSGITATYNQERWYPINTSFPID